MQVYIEDAAVKTPDELVREAVSILTKHDNNYVFGGGGPNFSEWKKDALRYLNNKG